MAKEHHCPNCGPQPCNASASKIHTCGVCAAVWEEVLGEGAPSPSAPVAAAAPPKPAAPVPLAAPAPKAVAPATAQASPPNPGSPTPFAPPIAAPRAAAPAQPARPPAAKPPGAAPPAEPKPSPAVTVPKSPTPIGRRLSDVVDAARVKRCPLCRSESIAQPSDFLEVNGRIVLIDSQSYRGHRWFADTGEAHAPSAAPPSTAVSRPSGTPAAANPAT